MAQMKKGDTVVVLSGDDKGKKGKILKLMPKDGLALVEGVNVRKRHRRARQEGKRGQVIDITHPIALSKLAPADRKKS